MTTSDVPATDRLEVDLERLPFDTDRGIGGPPWYNQFRAVGLEPIASAFDLATEVSAAANPINARGVATAINLDPAAPLEIRHSIRAFAVG